MGQPRSWRRRLHVRQTQPDDELDDVKSDDSDRIVISDEATAEVLVRMALDGPALPPVRLHDLRHGSATMLLAAGVR